MDRPSPHTMGDTHAPHADPRAPLCSRGGVAPTDVSEFNVTCDACVGVLRRMSHRDRVVVLGEQGARSFVAQRTFAWGAA